MLVVVLENTTFARSLTTFARSLTTFARSRLKANKRGNLCSSCALALLLAKGSRLKANKRRGKRRRRRRKGCCFFNTKLSFVTHSSYNGSVDTISNLLVHLITFGSFWILTSLLLNLN